MAGREIFGAWHPLILTLPMTTTPCKLEHLEAPLPPGPGLGVSARHCYWFDWMRFGAAFLVMLQHLREYHFVAYGDMDALYHKSWIAGALLLTHLGTEAVVVFFVLSGYLVGGRSAQKVLAGIFSPLEYVIDRATRIYVTLLPALLLTLLSLLWRGGHDTVISFLGNVAGVQFAYVEVFGGNGPLWTLTFEIWFYVLWGGVMTLLVGKTPLLRAAAWLAVSLALGMFTRLDAVVPSSGVFLYCWLLGALACVYESKVTRQTDLVPGLLLLLVGIVFSKMTGGSAELNLKWPLPLLPSHPFAILLMSIGLCVVLTSVSQWEPPTLWWRKVEKSGTWLAAFSYTLYLTHYPLVLLWSYYFPKRATAFDLQSLGTFFLEMLFCLAAAWVLYQIFEKNTSKVRKWATRLFLPNKRAGQSVNA